MSSVFIAILKVADRAQRTTFQAWGRLLAQELGGGSVAPQVHPARSVEVPVNYGLEVFFPAK